MKIGFIGCGNMGSAMISGMLKKGLYKKDEIIVSNLTEEGSKRSKEKLGVVTTLDNCEVVKNTKLVFLAVKPQFYEEVLNEVKDGSFKGANVTLTAADDATGFVSEEGRCQLTAEAIEKINAAQALLKEGKIVPAANFNGVTPETFTW